MLPNDVTHDFLAYLAQEMIAMNKTKQVEMSRFLSWLESLLGINEKNGESGINSLGGKTILMNYLGDYQKGSRHVSWDEFWRVLEQNKRRFSVDLESVFDLIYSELGKSLNMLLPIKEQLKRTDWIIDQIVYRLYSLNNDEITIIEYPQYEQSLLEAKEKVFKGKQEGESISSSDLFDVLFQPVERFFNQVVVESVNQSLDRNIQGWDTLPRPIPVLLQAGEHSLLLTITEDYANTVLFWLTAAVNFLNETIFYRFKEQLWVTEQHCYCYELKDFIFNHQPLTLPDQANILLNEHEQCIREFMRTYQGRCNTFIANSILILLRDKQVYDIRRKSLSNTVIGKDEALYIRQWAINIFNL